MLILLFLGYGGYQWFSENDLVRWFEYDHAR